MEGSHVNPKRGATRYISAGGTAPKRLAERLLTEFNRRGWAGRVLSADRLLDMQANLERAHREGLFEESFYQERLCGFEFKPPPTLSDPKSVVVVAVPQPQIRVTFIWQGAAYPTIVPPTYQDSRKLEDEVGSLVSEVLTPMGFGSAPAILPKKLLAVHSGLAEYGKNNLAYVPGMGSFHRLVALYSDLPCNRDPWQEPRMMQRCEDCKACFNSCPSHAISDRRFLLRAERCITYWNEKPRGVVFPSWIEPSWHNCLVGCLRCQWFCPLNREFLEWFEDGPTFTEKETSQLLAGASLEELPRPTVDKLEKLEISEFPEVLSRNLAILLARADMADGPPRSRSTDHDSPDHRNRIERA